MIRAIIVDDEFLARQRVLTLLESYDNIKVVGKAKSGQQAIDEIEMKEPDLVFLDIQMPDFGGFEVLRKINPKVKPYIVFTTAFDSYAIKAFDIHALDYLLKPFDEDRFAESMKKVDLHFDIEKKAAFNKKLIRLVKEFQQPISDHVAFIAITDRGVDYKIDLDNVIYLEAGGNYISIHTNEKTHLIRSTMNDMTDKLNPENFIRIHRSVIVNKRYVKNVKYINNNEYHFHMKTGQSLQSGRSFKKNISTYLGS